MRFEQMLADALREEAESRDVDVTGLWVSTQERIEHEDVRPRPSRRLVPLVAAATVGLVAAGLAGLAALDDADVGPAEAPGSERPQEGGVADEFTCPEQITHDWTRPETVVDDRFVASLRGGPARQARVYGAPRYELEEAGDRAFLRFGNADGSLATLSEFRLVDGEWTRFRTDVCVGKDGSVAVPTRNSLDLSNHADVPYEPRGMAPGRASLIDSRPYYDTTGLVRLRSIWAHTCGRQMCLTSGVADSWTRSHVRSGAVPYDVSHLFLPRDEVEGRHNPYGLWALFDVDATVESVVAYDETGRTVGETSGRYVDGWPGQLTLLLAPFDEVEQITVTRRPGSTDPGEQTTRAFTPEELPGYDADLRR
jgi:hypothetical protein